MAKKQETTEKQVQKRTLEGEVVSVVENKTAHVLVEIIKMNKKYKKQYITTKKYAIHDEKNEAKVGDKVVFEECRPLSKTKKWRLVEILKKEKSKKNK